ncbi:hypothetical protein DUNSADRAFT_6337 [Dunaliella salina]|uniref:Uncharacterized protein n=1 Tax=Dunaliella salina TaxID=3046 RepID=A0ABQ7GNJ0_DUNSA|nr:hypothetical protein DUNSADRAFT_6337 [Dunaliella salina]|eukprot:KAF5836134.1 hypothetical protein DUNSADRAFT_6337 [Dunaliella salina]
MLVGLQMTDNKVFVSVEKYQFKLFCTIEEQKMQGPLPISMLEVEIQRVCNQLQHLERSIDELKEAFKTDPDPEYKSSIQENIVLVAKQRARLATLQEMHKTALCAVPTSDEPQACHQQQTFEHQYHRQPHQQDAQGMDIDQTLPSRIGSEVEQDRNPSPGSQGTAEDGVWL